MGATKDVILRGSMMNPIRPTRHGHMSTIRIPIQSISAEVAAWGEGGGGGGRRK